MLTGAVGSECVLEINDGEDIVMNVAITRGNVPPPTGSSSSSSLNSSQRSQQITPVKTTGSVKGAEMTGSPDTKTVDLLVAGSDAKRKSSYRLPGSSAGRDSNPMLAC